MILPQLQIDPAITIMEGVDPRTGARGHSMITTPRLTLMPATVVSVRAEIANRDAFARLLQATVPDNWPPADLADALPVFLGWMENAPDQVGWFGWYALATSLPGTAPVLVGGGGFKGPPAEGTVEIGYSVLPQYEGRGYATEMVEALVRWALDHPGVLRVVAETEWANPASVRVLQKVGFTQTGRTSAEGGAHFALGDDAG